MNTSESVPTTPELLPTTLQELQRVARAGNALAGNAAELLQARLSDWEILSALPLGSRPEHLREVLAILDG